MLFQKLAALWAFSRPHTVIGTTLSVLALYAMAATSLGQLLNSLAILGPAAIACLLANIYIVGLNQLTDVEIDRVNKPHLPVASGALTLNQGIGLIVGCLAMGLGLAWGQGKYLFLTVLISIAIGTLYSLPPIRLKRFPLWAAVCIFGVRGLVINLGLYLHFNFTLNRNDSVTSPIWLLSIFILVFTYVIAIFKDMPDVEGDRQFNITTLTINLGQVAVFNLSRYILIALYTVAGIFSLSNANLALGISHGLLAGIFWLKSNSVNLGDRSEIAQFYQFIWRLFYLEYLIFPLFASNFLIN